MGCYAFEESKKEMRIGKAFVGEFKCALWYSLIIGTHCSDNENRAHEIALGGVVIIVVGICLYLLIYSSQ